MLRKEIEVSLEVCDEFLIFLSYYNLSGAFRVDTLAN